MNKFNHADYLKYPNKYALFKTATLDCTILYENGVVEKDTVVGLEFVEHKFSPFYCKDLPLYKLSTGVLCWGNKLSNFVL